ncbi:anaphase-promoting complex subunit 10 [Histoplasma capsulatum]|uniref:Anaphase-promoting complex subunit 10 n=1 Tax=Ajellomyces capsulatus TaxID=5037 RepID=A0A8A1MKS4_AJECA|nr:anaphase-promoting complex subunit 10 [Histoplasma capsulatum]
MPRHGLRRGVGGHSAFPSEDGASASTPSNDRPHRHPNFEPPVPARNPRAEIFPANDGHPRLHNLPIGGDPDLADTEEDLGDSGEERDDEDEDDIDIDIEDEEGDDEELRHEEGELPGQYQRINQAAASQPSATRPPPSSGNPTGPSHTRSRCIFSNASPSSASACISTSNSMRVTHLPK